MKTLGSLGGLGPDTTAEFYRMVVRRARRRFYQSYPRILIHSIPVPFEVERSIVRHGTGEERMYPLLEEGLLHLERAGADYLVIPCNTVHMFHRDLQQQLSVPLLNILTETARVCGEYGFRRVGILATGKTLEKRLYQNALEAIGIEALEPNGAERESVGALIYRILGGEAGEAERRELLDLSESLAAQGAEAIILGCTDLQHLVSPQARPHTPPDEAVLVDELASPVALVDSLEALARAAVREMGEEAGNG